MQSIYLDHNATTPPRPEVIEVMARLQAAGHGNPASGHRPGQKAHRLLEEARHGMAQVLGANLEGTSPDRLILTSGGTEANNLAVLGLACGSRKIIDPCIANDPGRSPVPRRNPLDRRIDYAKINKSPQLVISAIEHASIIGPAEHLMEEHGWRLDTLGVSTDGVICADRLQSLLSDRTGLVSMMAANHEIGTIQPIDRLAETCNAAGVPLHTDAVQMVGRQPVDFRRLGVAALSLAAHKFHGPLGIGALLLRHGVPLEPILFGGHQQDGLRPGTESVVLAVGMWTALRLWQEEQTELISQLTALRDRFESGLLAAWPGLIPHGDCAARLPQTSNIAFPDFDGQQLFLALDAAGVTCSLGAACTSGAAEVSPTLLALGIPNSLARSSLRFSLGRSTTEAEIDEAVARIVRVCSELGSR